MPNRYGLPTREEIDAGYKQGAAYGTGLNARAKLLALPAVVGEGVRSGARVADRAINATATGARDFFSGFSGGNTVQSPATDALPSIPPATQNAVVSAANVAESSPNVGAAVTVPPRRSSNNVAGPVSTPEGRAPGYYNPVQETQQAPQFATPYTPSGGGYGSISFPSIPQAVAQGAAGVGAPGQLPSEFHSQIRSLMDEARPLLSSKGIVDRLRGRQLMRARDRLIGGATSIAGTEISGANALTGARGADAQMLGAQTSAYRATNEVPLELLRSATQRYGVDRSADSSRYGTDVNALTSWGNARLAHEANVYGTDRQSEVALRGIESRTALESPRARLDDMAVQALERGDSDTYRTIRGQEPRVQGTRFTDADAFGGRIEYGQDGAYQWTRDKATGEMVRKRISEKTQR